MTTIRGWTTFFAVTTIAFVFLAKMVNYIDPPLSRPVGLSAAFAKLDAKVHEVIRNTSFLHSCGQREPNPHIPGPRERAARTPGRGVEDRIFRTYPLRPGGRQLIYASTGAGSKAKGEALLSGIVEIPRYRPVRIPIHPTWREDPLEARYWRFNFYALRPTENLLAAYLRTGDARFARALVRLDLGFIRAEPTSPYSWSDYHAVAFRAMVLAHEWWTLREYHQLPEAASSAFLRELEKTGAFLLDRNHYQPGYNHGANEAAALLQLGVAFPDLPGADAWATVARQRLAESLQELIDRDGILVENSPYYHFYVLDKYWQILRFAERRHVTIATDFRPRLLQMIRYATYVLHPDSSVPLLGASLAEVIHEHGTFAQMAAVDPHFRYVLSHGRSGAVPPQTSIFFSHAGQTFMRSGWGSGTAFERQSYLTFNVGAYRTNHSQLDSLGITLFGGGRVLLPAPGLYTYPDLKHPNDPLYRYFHGTSSHNTVVVDGRDQVAGSASPGPLVRAHGLTYQSAESSLYSGVTHRRLVMMIDRQRFLLVDRLSSDTVHTYSQVFHLFVGARVSREGTTVTGESNDPDASIRIAQLAAGGAPTITTGRIVPPAGLCSRRYQRLLACPQVAYSKRGKNAVFVTLLTVGHPRDHTRLSYASSTAVIRIVGRHGAYTIRLRETTAVPANAAATDATPPSASTRRPLDGTRSPRSWRISGAARAARAPRGIVVSVKTMSHTPVMVAASHVRASLARTNLQIRFRVINAHGLVDLRLRLRSPRGTATNDLTAAYPARYGGEWVTVSLGRSRLRDDPGGRWDVAQDFEWGSIRSVELLLQSRASTPVTLQVAFIRPIPEQREGAVVIVFDDGYSSILHAAAYLRRHGLRANVAVIGKYVRLPRSGYLSLDDLHRLQDAWGWNMVNHSDQHRDAVQVFGQTHDLSRYREDIVAGATFLQTTGLDSAPDWYVYPHGSTNARLERVVGSLYKFARTTDEDPEAYPFGDPLRVKTLEVRGNGDSEGGGVRTITTPSQILHAAADAMRYRTTLVLTFHRIHGETSDPPGYPFALFTRTVDGLTRAHIRVLTFSGLDHAMGVPDDNRIIATPGRPSRIALDLLRFPAQRHRGFVSRVLGWL